MTSKAHPPKPEVLEISVHMNQGVTTQGRSHASPLGKSVAVVAKVSGLW